MSIASAVAGESGWERLASLLVGYCTGVRPGERALITMVETETFPLVRALNAELVRAGARVHVELQSALLERDLLLHGADEQVGWVCEPSRMALEWADVYYGIRGASNPFTLDGVPAERIAAHRRTLGVLAALRTERTRWVLVRVPTDALAQQAGMALDDVMQMFWRATLRDWEAEARAWSGIHRRLAGARRIRITGPGTDLELGTEGRTFLLEDGRVNMPGGEVYTSPVEDSARGTIRFGIPATFAGRSATGVRLTFERGRVVSFDADSGADLLRSLLAMDDGAAGVGEVGLGLNAGMSRFCGDPLWDEKILGTAHIALGRSYAACGGRNQSALHWDLVTDLRPGGSVEVDGRVVVRDGVFVEPV